jgi:pre-60S factor REI1
VLNSDTGNDETEASSPLHQSCIACEQHYTNQKAWQAHLKSRNHTKKSAEFNSKASFVSDECPSLSTLSLNSRKEDQPADEEENFSPLLCLFCNVESTSLDSNLTHMSHVHSFFLMLNTSSAWSHFSATSSSSCRCSTNVFFMGA